MARFQEVLNQLETLINSSSMRGGDKLPPERTLAETFGTSRSSVREAIRILAERGILESRQGDGTYLCAIGAEPDGLRRACAEAFDAHRRRLAKILEFRLALEPGIATLAARNADPHDLERLKALACDQQRRILTGEDDAALDAAFHLQLAHATHNPVIVDVLTALDETLAQSRSEYLRNPDRKRRSQEDHLRLIDAVESHDPTQARRAMEDHLDSIAAALAQEMDP